jgi:acetate kinase
MKILSINAGSSSLKFRLFEMPEEKVLCAGIFERIGLGNSFYTITIGEEKIKKETPLHDHEECVKILIKELINLDIVENIEEIEGIGHRLVHGGEKYSNSVIINEDVLNFVTEISYLAPLHNPANILGVRVFNEVLPKAKGVAVFDTAFHQTMDKEAYIYPIPYEWYEKYGIRKYGFHGTSHKYISLKISEILNNKNLKVISCHLGNGGSLCAIKDGKSIDTTMGFTPLAGIPMGTRCGDIDPSIIPFMVENSGKTISEINNDLNKKSGFLGVSGISADARDIEDGVAAGDERAMLAYNIYIRKVVSFISSYNTLLGGADVICFSAGIGENSVKMRKDIVDMLSPLGVYLDEEANNVRGKTRLISTKDSKIQCYIIPTDEELMIAKETYELIK